MVHIEVLILFNEIFNIKNEIEEWFPNGKNSVRIRLKEKSMLPFMIGKGEDLIFTAESRNEWRLETVESWIKNTMGMRDDLANLEIRTSPFYEDLCKSV